MSVDAKLRTLLRGMKYETAAMRFVLAARALERHYRPDQPRVPAGNPDGGEWTAVGGTVAGDRGRQSANVIYVCVRVGSVPVRDEFGSAAYAVSYLCGFDNALLSWTTAKKPRAIIPDPRF